MSTEVCEDGHAEITYEGGGAFSGYKNCPLCEARDEATEHAEELTSAESENETLTARVEELEKEGLRVCCSMECVASIIGGGGPTLSRQAGVLLSESQDFRHVLDTALAAKGGE